MTETTVGREPIQIVEILQPICANVFGSSPCTATGEKCYNTRATCKDSPNFALDATPLSLFFSSGKVAEIGVTGADYIIPALRSVSTAPTKINLASANPDAQGLGQRAVCNISLVDHPHTDRLVDPYLSGRSFDPYARASFWTKWMVRNRYRQNVQIRVYEGYAGQALATMVKRTYFLQSITGPDDGGAVTIQGKDILARVEERKAQAPALSPGKLYAALTDVATSFEAANAVEADYSATGTLRINREVMTYTGRATSTNGVTFTGLTRGTDGTTAAEHAVDDAVQQCLRYTAQRPDDIAVDLLETYAGVSASWLDAVNWEIEVDDYLSSFALTRLITKPTAVTELLSEMQEQALFNLVWNEREALVKFKAIRALTEEPDVITAESNILAGSFHLTELPRERVSQVWIYYGLRNAVEDSDDAKNYTYSTIVADLESETDALYGEASIRKIYAKWLPSAALVNTTASKISNAYRDIPAQCSFQMDAKDRSYWVGDVVSISHHLDVDQFGDRQLRFWTIVSAEETVPGEIVEYLCQDITNYGKTYYILASGAADYDPDNVPFKSAYIGNSLGQLSDGANSARIT